MMWVRSKTRRGSFSSELGRHFSDELRAGRINRRDLLCHGTAMGLSMVLLQSIGIAAPFQAVPPRGAIPRRGGTLRVGIARPTIAPDPMTSNGKSNGYILQPVLPPLARPQADGSLRPCLATAWSCDQSVKEWTFSLRPTVWADDTPFTADDLIATFDTLLNPVNPAPTVAAFHGILAHGQYEKRDAHTIVFHLQRPFVDFAYLISYGAVRYFPKGYQLGQFARCELGGIGPFVMKTYHAERGATYLRNTKYWDADNIHLDGLDIRFFDDEQSMTLSLQAGELDVIPTLASSAVIALAKNPDIQVLDARSSAYDSLRMHVDAAPFADSRVRRALAHSIDRPAIVDTIYSGAGDLGNDHVFAPAFPQSAGIAAAIPQRVRNIPQARSLLSEAGYPAGLKLAVVSEQYGDIPQFLQLVQSQALAAGFDITLDLRAQSEYYGSGLSRPWLQSSFGSTDWGERASPGQMISTAYLSGAPFNESHYASPEFDEAAKAFDGELDPVRRTQYAIRAARLLHDDVPAIVAFFGRTRRPVSTRVRGMPAGPGSALDVTGVWLG